MPPKQNKPPKKAKRRDDSSDSDDDLQPSGPPASTTLPPVTQQALENAAPGIWYTPAPQGYKFVNTKPKNLAERIQALRGGKKKKPKAPKPPPPDTKEFYDSKGAVEQPPDGANVMKEAESCLTCISQGGNCHGTTVSSGKCLSCRGIGITAPRQVRTCRWRQPQKGVYTFNKHLEVNGVKQVEKNTSKYKQANKKPDSDAEAELSFLTIWDFAADSHTAALLRWLAALVVDNGFLTEDLNLDALANVARARYVYASRNPQTFPSPQVQQQVMLALNEIYSRLKDMKKNGSVITMGDLLEILPFDHPAYMEDSDDE